MTVAVGNDGLTMLDIMKRLNPDGSLATSMIELMAQENGLLKDAVWQQGKLNTGDRILRRSSVPQPEFRRMNAGVGTGKSLTDQVDESVGLMETLSIVDVRLAKLGGNPAAVRATEDMAFREGFNNLWETTMWYGNTATDPDQWLGFAPRFAASSGVAFSGQVVKSDITASGNDQHSAWFIDWGVDSVCAIYALGNDGTLHIEDLGVELVTDADGKRFRAYRTAFDWECGLKVANPLHVVRVPNIDTSAIVASGNLLVTSLVKGYHQLRRGGKTVCYMDPFTAAFLHLQAISGAINGTLTIADPSGMPVTMICGVPVRISQGLKATESAIT